MPYTRRFATLLISLLLAAQLTYAAQPAKTLIADTIYRADGTPAAGTLVISWPAFSTAGGEAVAAGSKTVKIGAAGAVALELIPTQGAVPAAYYKVTVRLDDGTSTTEYWAVPTLSPTTIAAIRSSIVPAGVALQAVSREYVDSAFVRKRFDETVDGVKTFSSSPLLPPPGADAAAATKQYVDTVVAAANPHPLTIDKGGTGTTSFTPARCVRVANDGSKLESAATDCSISGSDADTVDNMHAAQLLSESTAVTVSSRTGADLAARISAAIAALGAGGGRVPVDIAGGGTISSDVFSAIAKPVHFVFSGGQYNFPAADVTIPANVTVEVLPGSLLSVPDGRRLTINGRFSGPMARTFAGAGKVALRGNDAIYPQWYGAVGDGVTDDSAALNAAINNGDSYHAPRVVLRKTHDQNWLGGTYGVSQCDYFMGATTLAPAIQGTIIEGDLSSSWDGATQLCWNNAAMTTPFVRPTSSALGITLRHLDLRGNAGFDRTNLTTYDFPNGNHGIQMDQARGYLEDVAVYNAGGHCIVMGGSAPNGNDSWSIHGSIAQGCRGYGIFTGDASSPGTFAVSPSDSSAGVGYNNLAYFNQMGGIGEFSRFGNLYTNPHFNGNNSGGIAPGAESSLSSASRTAGTVTVVAAADVAGLVNKTWVTIGGTGTGMDEPCHVNSVADPRHFTCTQTGDADVAPAAAGSVRTSTTVEVYGFYNTHQGNWKTGAFAATTGTFLAPYCEFNELPADLGISATVLGVTNCSVIGAMVKPQDYVSFTAGGGSQASITGGSLALRHFGDSDTSIDCHPGLTASKACNVRFLDLSGNEKWRVGQVPGDANQFGIFDAAHNGYPLHVATNSTVTLQSWGGTGLNLQGPDQLYSISFNGLLKAAITSGGAFIQYSNSLRGLVMNTSGSYYGVLYGSGPDEMGFGYSSTAANPASAVFRFNRSGGATLGVQVSTPKLTGITDTAVVANLNADLVDGKHAAELLPTAASKIRICEVHIGSPGGSALADTDDEPASCFNDFGATLTITAVRCYADGGSPTVTPILTGGAATSILTGALTCGTANWASGTLNGTPTLTSGSTIDANITTAGGTAKYIRIVVSMTL